MASETRQGRPPGDDGVRVIRTPGVSGAAWFLVAAIGLVALALLFVVRPLFLPTNDSTASQPEAARDTRMARQAAKKQPAPAPAAARVDSARLPAAPVQIPAAPATTPADGEAAASGETDSAAAAGAEAASGDQPTGIALFPPPGTDPPKVGIIVPDGFELPPGYIRHYQVTDDGQALAPILMFHPDFKLLDEKGNPVAMPADGVVPPDMAPPGLPIHMLEVPDTEAPLAEAPAGQSGEEPSP